MNDYAGVTECSGTDPGVGDARRSRSPRPRAFVSNGELEHERRLLVAARLREALDGIPRTQIARRTGWSKESIRRYMQGVVTPPVTLLMALHEEYAVSPSFVLLGRGPARATAEAPAPRAVSREQMLDALHYLIAQIEATGERVQSDGRVNGRPAAAARPRPAPRGSPDGSARRGSTPRASS